MAPTRVLSTSAIAGESVLGRAGAWFLNSGIQEPTGGVARYYLSDATANARVSTEITGYAVSALVYLHGRNGRAGYLAAALRAGEFLVRTAWNRELRVFPFEHVAGGTPPEPLAYFFDTGIVARGLLALWRSTGAEEFRQGALRAAESLEHDFTFGNSFHPILRLPEKTPLAHTPQWSRSPGCYQLKSALAWRDLHMATGDDRFLRLYERALRSAVDAHSGFLPAETPEKTMDRLHAYSYFLEAALPASSDAKVRTALQEGIARVSAYLREIAPRFERSDVYAQILRVRLLADELGAVSLDEQAAEWEAARIPVFQLAGVDPRIDGGFTFGRKGPAVLPYVNPVSAAFCSQAIGMWNDRCSGVALDPGSLI